MEETKKTVETTAEETAAKQTTEQVTEQAASTVETAAAEDKAVKNEPKKEKKPSWFKRHWKVIFNVGGAIVTGICGYLVAKKFDTEVTDSSEADIVDENGNTIKVTRQDFSDGSRAYWVNSDQ